MATWEGRKARVGENTEAEPNYQTVEEALDRELVDRGKRLDRFVCHSH